MIWGILWHIFDNGWEDREFIRQRVWGMDQIKSEVKNWTPEETERVTGIPGSQLKRVARTLANNRPGTIIWCMGGTQHTQGNNNTRAYCVLQLALGNMGVSGGGANIFRGHDNVQGATDMCVLSHSLPGYYGLKTGSWKHWCRVWDVDYEWMKGRFASKKLMESKGIPVSRWIDGVLENKDKIDQPDNVRAMVFWGHAPNSQTRLPEMKTAMEKLDLLVIIDPYPTFSAVIPDRKDGIYLLPAATQFETSGSRTATNRSLQWGEKFVEPLFESKPDHTIMYLFAKKFGVDKEMFKHIAVKDDEPLVEDLTREFNKGMWTIGYTGQSPERLKLHMANQATFDKTTLQAKGGPADGDFYGLPWPCWGNAAMNHPGTPNLYDTSKPVAEGGLCFRARFGVEREGQNLLAEGSYPVGSEIKDGYPEFTMAMLKKLGWDKDLTAEERAAIDKVAGDKTNWKTDLSGGYPAGRRQARVRALRQRQGPCGGVDLPGSGAAAPRAALHQSAGSAAQVRDIRGQAGLPPADQVRVDSEERLLQGVPDDPHLGAPGGVRGRRRRNPVQPVAGRASAEHVLRAQSARRQQHRRQGRPASLGA